MCCDTRLACHGDFALRPQARMASGTSSAWPCARPPATTGEACNLFCLTIWEINEQDFMIFHDISWYFMLYDALWCFMHVIIFLLTWPFEGYAVASHLLGWTSNKNDTNQCWIRSRWQGMPQYDQWDFQRTLASGPVSTSNFHQFLSNFQWVWMIPERFPFSKGSWVQPFCFFITQPGSHRSWTPW